MALEIRTITDDEVTAYRETLMQTFGVDADADEGGVDRHRKLVDLSQSWAAFEGNQIVATAATFNHQMSLPLGGSLPMAGLTMVTVRPSHRRKGLLRQLMTRHLDDARARNFPVSGLWASESKIYGRFGYGIAAFADAYEIPNAHALEVGPGRDLDDLEWIDEGRAREVLPAIYARATDARPGALRRSPAWWRERRFIENAWSRKGASRRRYVLAKRGRDLVGYIAYRQRDKFTGGLPDGRLEINELISIDARAAVTLWKFACSVDLFPTVTWWNAPPDDALPWNVDDLRRVKRSKEDTLWLCIEDVPAALAARGYTTDGTLRIAVGGWTYELVAEGGKGTCEPTSKAPDISCTKQTLATLYLGAVTATNLAQAGIVRGEAKSLALADALFSSPLAAWCPEIF
ncbi:MAG: GNAT family N-acetyltransferase [Kofleriaceae bacterium]|nr:GNAT family N-acetyltransferase [Kofleriaceae bacterium]